MNLKALDQLLPLHRDEAVALRDALHFYHTILRWHSAERPLYLAETMSLRPTLRVHDQLGRLLAGPWPRTRYQVLRARRWRVGFDEVLLLNSLLVAGELFVANRAYESAFNTLYAKINRAALALDQHFRL